MELNIIGGCYREHCHWPYVNEVQGSGGRAARLVEQLSERKAEVSFHTYLSEENATDFKRHFAFSECKLNTLSTDFSPKFEYTHPLAKPHICPDHDFFSKHELPLIEVSADNILLFGMMEADATVRANQLVYDPQSSVMPKRLAEINCVAKKIALVLNRSEADNLYKRSCSEGSHVEVEALADKLLSSESVDIVVIKCGHRGAYVLDGGRNVGEWVPSYKTSNVYPIGSGDCFSGAFAYFWMLEGLSAPDAARRASLVTAYYCQNRTFPISSEVDQLFKEYVENRFSDLSRKKVYLAGPFFNVSQMWLINESLRALSQTGLEVFSPYHDIGPGPAEEVAHQDVQAIEESDVLFALFDDLDPGTLYEIGYARKAGKPVVIYAETATEEQLKMFEGTGCIVCRDYSTSIYQLCWSLND